MKSGTGPKGCPSCGASRKRLSYRLPSAPPRTSTSAAVNQGRPLGVRARSQTRKTAAPERPMTRNQGKASSCPKAAPGLRDCMNVSQPSISGQRGWPWRSRSNAPSSCNRSSQAKTRALLHRSRTTITAANASRIATAPRGAQADTRVAASGGAGAARPTAESISNPGPVPIAVSGASLVMAATGRDAARSSEGGPFLFALAFDAVPSVRNEPQALLEDRVAAALAHAVGAGAQALEGLDHLSNGRFVALEELQAKLLEVAVRPALGAGLEGSRPIAERFLLQLVDVAPHGAQEELEPRLVVLEFLRGELLLRHGGCASLEWAGPVRIPCHSRESRFLGGSRGRGV